MIHPSEWSATKSTHSASSWISKMLGMIIDASLYLSIALVPLFFLPMTLDILELNKQTLLLVLMLLGTTAWLGKALIDRHFMLSRAWMHLVVVLFAIGWLITSLFSKDLYLSLVGNVGQMQWSFATILAFILFYILLNNRIRNTRDLYQYLLVFLGSTALAGAFGFLQMLGVYPLGWLAGVTRANTFNTIGTINAFGVFMAIPLVLATSLTVFGCRDRECVLGKKAHASIIENIIVWAALLISLLVAIVVDFWVIWAAALFGLALLVILPIVRSLNIRHPARIAVPVILACISVLLLIFKTPIDLALPAEVSPSMTASWNIAQETLSESPLFGSGPGTWMYDYAKYRSPSVNLSQFWTVRFERGISAFLTLLAMIGMVGISLWLILIISGVVKSATHLIKERDDDEWQAYLSIFVGWMTTVFIAFVYNYNFAHHFAFWLLLALLAALTARKAFVWEAQKNGVAGSLAISVLFIALCVAALSTIWMTTQRFVADMAYSNAVQAYHGGKSIDESIDYLNRAVAMNRLNDGYYRNLSQAYLIKAGQEFEQLRQQPDGAARMNQLIAASIDTARRATEINGMNVDNWENIAIVYQTISGFTQGADEFALKHFESALEREPNNPVYALEIAKLHLMRSDALQTMLQAQDEETRVNAQKDIEGEWTAALEWLNRAVASKPDFAPAHYYIGLIYDRQGRVGDAVKKLEEVLSVDTRDVGIAFQLAILYYRNDEKAKSLELFKQIVAFAPQYANARWYLSALLEEAGEYSEALNQVQIVKQTNPDNELVINRVQYLKQLIAQNGGQMPSELLEPVEQKITSPQEQNPIQQ